MYAFLMMAKSMAKKQRLSLFLIFSALAHGSLLVFFMLVPAETPRAGVPTVSVDVIAAPVVANVRAPHLVAKRSAVPSKKPREVPVPRAAASPENSPEPAAVAANTEVPSGPRGGAIPGSVISAYVVKIVTLLNQHKLYPQEAIDREQEGKVVLEVTLGADGQVKEAKVVQPSFYEVLNQAALRTVQRIARFPPPPDPQQDFHFTAPLQYRIERR